MTAINSNRAIRGPVTAVPVVAGKGVRLVADTENNRWVVEADETVLFTASGSGAQSGSVSEAYTNFERIRIEVGIGNQAGDDGCTFVEISTRFPKMWLMYGMGGGGANAYYCASKLVFSDTTTWSVTNGSAILHADTSTTVTGNTQYNANIKTCVWKMIGINRIASN